MVSTTVGRVADQVVTSREVAINHLIELALFKKGAIPKSELNAIAKKSRKEAVASVLMEWVVYLEAQKFSTKKVSASEVTRARKKVLGKLKNKAVWQRLQVGEGELRSAIRRKLQSKEFIRFRIDSSFIPITDAEVKSYFDENRVQFGNLPFESFEKNIRAFLKKRQVEKRLKDWFDVLQRKYKVSRYSIDG